MMKGVAMNHEAALLGDLLEGYNRHARPVSDVLSPVDVSISFYLTKIVNLDEKNEVLTTFGWLEVHWLDDFLTWNPSDYGGLSRIIVPSQLIWLPDFGLENSVDAIYNDQADEKFRVGVYSDGRVRWVPGGKFTTSCDLDISLYPFDSQRCEMHFVDWTYDGRTVNLINGSQSIGLGAYKKHSEWELIDTESTKLDQYFDSNPEIPFPTVKFLLWLRRKPLFYMMNVVTPCIIMSILAGLVFYLPPDSGEKVSLGITVLLAFSVFLLLIAENIPKVSDYVPLLGIYLTMVMVMTAVSIVISVIVLDLHHRSPSSTVPPWLRRIVFGFMARVLRIKTPYTATSHATVKGTQSNRSRPGFFDRWMSFGMPFTTNFVRVKPTEPSMTKKSQTKGMRGSRHSMQSEVNIHADDEMDTRDTAFILGDTSQANEKLDAAANNPYDEPEHPVTGPPRIQKPLLEILHRLREITNNINRNLKRDFVQEEWKLLAKIIDRFLLVIFLVAITSLSVSILYIYPKLSQPVHGLPVSPDK